MDRVPDLGLRGRAEKLASGVDGVCGVQRIDVHPLGSQVRMDVEVSVDGDLSVRKGHAIAHEVAEAVTRGEAGVVEVAVHVNPSVDGAVDGPADGPADGDVGGDPGSGPAAGTG